MGIFSQTRFLVIKSSSLSPHDPHEHNDLNFSRQICELIEENGGQVYTVPKDEPAKYIQQHKINHIVAETLDFQSYNSAVTCMVPVTTKQWVTDSVAYGQRRNYRLYAPLPAPFMNRVVLCVADNLPAGDKEAMYAGVRAFGGQYLDALLRYTTHLVAADLTTPKLVVAANLARKDGPHIHIVLPHWVDACIRQQRHVNEQAYLLNNPVVVQTGKPDYSVDSDEDDVALITKLGDSETGDPVLGGKTVFVAADFLLSEHLLSAVHALIERLGGRLIPEFSPNVVDIYIGKYRAGPEYCQSILRKPKPCAVASLAWLYHVATSRQYIDPWQSNMLHFPVPQNEVPEFRGCLVSITGITGDARHYLATLLTNMGATFTKTLDCNNQVLVCALRSGAKYTAAVSRWPSVTCVSPSWIEKCYASWKYLDPNDTQFSVTNSPPPPLGQIRLSPKEIVAHALGISQDLGADPPLDVADSMHEGSLSPTPLPVTVDLESPKKSQNANISMNLSASEAQKLSQDHSQIHVQSQLTQKSQDPVFLSSPALARASRSAKAKASLKLLSDMEDLNQYTLMAKSARKMKSYMAQLEQATPTKKLLPQPHLQGMDTVAEPVAPPLKRAKIDKAVHLRAILTGCEQVLTLTKSDTTRLLKLGIQIVADYAPNKPIDAIVAPKVLRTEKFLKSLSKALRIVHPTFLADILAHPAIASLSWTDIAKEFNLEHYALDKVVPVKQINDDLGVEGKTSGLTRLLSRDLPSVFEGYTLNLSLNLNGGADLIASILREHGLAALKTVKLTAGVRKTGLLAMEDSSVILIAHKTKDKKFAAKLDGVTVVEWEWCVKSIFHKQVQHVEDYAI